MDNSRSFRCSPALGQPFAETNLQALLTSRQFRWLVLTAIRSLRLCRLIFLRNEDLEVRSALRSRIYRSVGEDEGGTGRDDCLRLVQECDWNPDKSLSGPVSVIVSSADKTVYVYRNGVEIGRTGIPNPRVVSPLNDLVFSALQGTDSDGHLRRAEVTATGESKSSQSIFWQLRKAGCQLQADYDHNE